MRGESLRVVHRRLALRQSPPLTRGAGFLGALIGATVGAIALLFALRLVRRRV